MRAHTGREEHVQLGWVAPGLVQRESDRDVCPLLGDSGDDRSWKTTTCAGCGFVSPTRSTVASTSAFCQEGSRGYVYTRVYSSSCTKKARTSAYTCKLSTPPRLPYAFSVDAKQRLHESSKPLRQISYHAAPRIACKLTSILLAVRWKTMMTPAQPSPQRRLIPTMNHLLRSGLTRHVLRAPPRSRVRAWRRYPGGLA